MRAISLWEPWATAIAKGLKKIETRSWEPQFRGRVAIHAAKTTLHAKTIIHPVFRQYFEPLGIIRTTQLNFGCVVAVCDLVRVEPTEICEREISQREYDFGNYDAGRFGWILENIVELTRPFAWKGRQGFFDVPERFIDAALVPVTESEVAA